MFVIKSCEDASLQFPFRQQISMWFALGAGLSSGYRKTKLTTTLHRNLNHQASEAHAHNAVTLLQAAFYWHYSNTVWCCQIRGMAAM